MFSKAWVESSSRVPARTRVHRCSAAIRCCARDLPWLDRKVGQASGGAGAPNDARMTGKPIRASSCSEPRSVARRFGDGKPIARRGLHVRQIAVWHALFFGVAVQARGGAKVLRRGRIGAADRLHDAAVTQGLTIAELRRYGCDSAESTRDASETASLQALAAMSKFLFTVPATHRFVAAMSSLSGSRGKIGLDAA